MNIIKNEKRHSRFYQNKEVMMDKKKHGYNKKRITIYFCTGIVLCLIIGVMAAKNIPHEIERFIKAVYYEELKMGEMGAGSLASPSTDSNATTKKIKEIHRSTDFMDYNENNVSASSPSLDAPFSAVGTGYEGKALWFMNYDGKDYDVQGIMSSNINASDYLGDGVSTVSAYFENGDFTEVEESEYLAVYSISGVDTDFAVAAEFEGGDGLYLYINGEYSVDENLTLLEYLNRLGYDENSMLYVVMTTSSGSYGIYYTGISTEDLNEYFWESDAEQTDKGTLEESEFTGLQIHMTSDITGGSAWVYYYEGGYVTICADYSSTIGAPDETKIFELNDENAGISLIEQLANNYNGMIRYID